MNLVKLVSIIRVFFWEEMVLNMGTKFNFCLLMGQQLISITRWKVLGAQEAGIKSHENSCPKFDPRMGKTWGQNRIHPLWKSCYGRQCDFHISVCCCEGWCYSSIAAPVQSRDICAATHLSEANCRRHRQWMSRGGSRYKNTMRRCCGKLSLQLLSKPKPQRPCV